MPFDGEGFESDARGAEAFKVFGRKPTLRGLAYALRHREVWPPGFKHWDYQCPDTCAIRLTWELLGRSDVSVYSRLGSCLLPAFGCRAAMVVTYGISDTTALRIFCRVPHEMRRRGDRRFFVTGVTPEYVADEIDRVLAEGGAVAAAPSFGNFI